MLLPWPLVLGALVTAPLLLATRAVLSPRVLRASDADEEDLGENAHVLLAGSCNPLHSGHVALLRRMAARHPRSRLFCCVAFNPAKRYAVSPQARCELAAAMCAAAGLGERVHCVVVPQYPWRFGLRSNVAVMYRGIRTWAKDGLAESVLQGLNVFGPLLLEAALPPETRYIEASPELVDLSSTVVRKRAAAGESLVGLVPKGLEARVADLYR